jgi:hypothetical protein
MFTRNPEQYRLYQCIGYKAIEQSRALLLGIAGHEFMDADARGKEFSAVFRELKEQGISAELIATAEVLAKRLIEDYPADKSSVMLSEREFVYQIPGSPHQLVGKMDRVILLPNTVKEPQFGILDWKFKSKPGYRQQMYEQEKIVDVQPMFYVLGATTFGYQAEEFTFVTAVKSVPIDIWKTPVPKERFSPDNLARFERQVHMVCEAIEFFTRTFGIAEPWPHYNHAFPCSKESYCEYRHICNEVHTPGIFPPGFCQKEDHLEVMKETNDAASK